MLIRIRWKQALTTVSLASLLSLPSLFWLGTAAAKPEEGASDQFPTRKVGGGTRRCPPNIPCPYDVLVALSPDGLATTAEALPTLYFYVPQIQQSWRQGTETPKLEFVLRDESDRLVYETTFPAESKRGIVPFKLPTSRSFQELTVGQNYHWYLSIIYNPSDRSYDDVVEGWIRRVAPNPELSRQLAQASLLQRVELFQTANLWYEAVNTLAELKRSRPDDPEINQIWNQLLLSVTPDGRLNQKPLLENDFQSGK